MSNMPYRSWQSLRKPVSSTDSFTMTTYTPNQVTQAIKDLMVDVSPAGAIAIRGFGTDAANEVATVIISGWMDPSSKGGVGPGHRLWTGTFILGSKTATFTPIAGGDSKWPSAAYLEVDLLTATDALAFKALDGTITGYAANQEGMLILPTFGYTHLLMDITLTSAASFGAIWRPLRLGDSSGIPGPAYNANA